MAQFFMLFEGRSIRLEKFIVSLTTKPGTEDAMIPHRTKLLAVLADACMEKSCQYDRLADDCWHKKRRAGQTVHLFD